MGTTFYFEFEPLFMEWLQNMLGTLGMHIASLFTMLGEEVVLIAILGFLYWCYDKELAKRIGLNIVVGIVWTPMIKNAVLRRRPYFDHPNVICLKPVDGAADIYDIAAQGYSFPSGHSTNSAIAYWSILQSRHASKFKLLRILLIIIPILVGFSRIALGVHYPSDVICGWVLGGMIVMLLPKIAEKVEKRWILHLAIFLISSIGVFYCRTDDYFTALGVMAGFFLAVPFEERYVNFQGTKNPSRILLRLAGGIAIYIALNTLLKLPFDPEFLASPVLTAFLIRSLRYAIILFVVMGVYPMVFRKG